MRTRRRGSNHLGTLRSRLADLQGYATLAYELVQNAEDAPNSRWLRFDLRSDALVVDNGGEFSSCGHLEVDPCPWAEAEGTGSSCDFHRFTDIGGGEKGLDPNAVGAFGIGFLAVYQITDSPNLISGGQHWILDEEADEPDRIKICDGCKECQRSDLPGTRFILPLAVEATPLRTKLRCRPVSFEDRSVLIDRLSSTLPEALLFLNNLRKIDLLLDGAPILALEAIPVDERLLVGNGRIDTEWYLFKGEMPAEIAGRLVAAMPAGETNRDIQVVLAFSRGLTDGSFFAWLPTQERLGLPFHVQADFFPSNDRKRLLWESDYRSSWNRAALGAAATALANSIIGIRDVLGPTRLWKLLLDARGLPATRDRPIDCFWAALLPHVKGDELVFTSEGNWVAPSGAVLVDARTRDELDAIRALGLKPIHEDLRFAWEALIDHANGAGVRLLRLSTAVSALRRLGLTDRTAANQLPEVLSSRPLRIQLWNLLDGLLGDRPPASAIDREALATCAVMIANDGSAVPCRDGYMADPETYALFASIDPTLPFVDLPLDDFLHLAGLVPHFSVGNAVAVLERNLGKTSPTSVGPDSEAIRLLKWFGSRTEDIDRERGLGQRLAVLPIFPSKNRCGPLTELSLPGQFHDPLGLAEVIDDSNIQECIHLLRVLGVKDLSIVEYVSVHLTRALRDPALPTSQRHAALGLLVDRMSEFVSDSKCMQALAGLEIVLCQDGTFARASEAYLPTDELSLLPIGDVRVAQTLKGHEEASKQFYQAIGVATKPRLVDLVTHIRRLVSTPPSAEAIDQITRCVQALAARVTAGGSLPEALDALRTEAWLPSDRNDHRWFSPKELAASFQRSLFQSQATFLGLPLPVQQNCTDFLRLLGVATSPTTEQIVKHLIACSESNTPVSDGVYRALNANDRVTDKSLELLTRARCIYIPELGYKRPNHVFWGQHPFGPYRVALGDELRTFYNFFSRVGVGDAPSYEDALDVLQEVAADPTWLGKSLTTEVQGVVSRCWKLLADAFDRGDIDAASVEELSSKRVITGTDGLLNQPDRMFLADNGSLAEHFRTTLGANLIPITAGATAVMEAAGVQRISNSVEMNLIESTGRCECESLRLRISERAIQISRVASSNDRVSVTSLLNALTVERVDRLVVQYSLRLFDRPLLTPLVSPGAVFLAGDNVVLVEMPASAPPWAAVARELATVLLAKDDGINRAAGILQALEPETASEADLRLDILGFPRMAAEADDSILDPVVTVVGASAEPGSASPPSGPPDEPVEEDSTPVDTASPAGNKPPTSTRRSSQPAKRSRFVTYVAQDDKTSGSQSPEQVAKRRKVELSGIEHVRKYEESAQRTVVVKPPNHPGYDLESSDATGAIVRYVEVKSTAGQWGSDGVGLTSTEFSCAQRLADAYWLYVVEFADTDEARIHPIQNPAGRSNHFYFDRGWIAVSEEGA